MSRSQNTGLIPHPSEKIIDFVSGGCAALTTIFVVFPLHKTIFVQQLQGVKWRTSAHQVFIRDFRFLYRGVLPPLCQKTASLSLMFGVYGQAQRVLGDQCTFLDIIMKKAAAAFFAGSCEAALMPFERVQTLLQDQRYHSHFKNTFHTASKLWRAEGIREFYRGLTPILLRNGSSNIVYFLVRDLIGDSEKIRADDRTVWRTLRDFINGAGLGAALGIATYPLNVAKTRMQSKIGGDFEGLPATIKEIYMERGQSFRKLYRGVLANCVRSMLSWGIITMSYEVFHSTFSKP